MRTDRLLRDLERRAAELSDEVRRYPGPIARCDEQLTALLEARARVHRLLARVQARAAQTGGCKPLKVWANDGGRN